ncbi:hypothetical protein BK022_00330 [Methylorubrum extorquens]|uniref:Uncharacterized protein n=1 Tax=Methylorubrum extorquens TaxID=408 RepID=A0A1S1PCK1_METEX|nr:hypothetical protein BK022_00330 [Methylorubrum extorquens]
MLDVIPEYIHIPSDEDEAAAFLCRLTKQRPDTAARTKRLHTATGSARAVLEALVEDGTFAGRISDDEARCFDEEARRYEAWERTNTGVEDCGYD